MKIRIDRVAFQSFVSAPDGTWKVAVNATVDGKPHHMVFRVGTDEAQAMLTRQKDKWLIGEFKKGIKNE